MLAWRLPHGRYRLTLSPTSQTREVTIRERGQRLDLVIPSRQEVEIELKLLEARPASWPLPDLAVSSRDMVVEPPSPKPGQRAVLTVKVHNLGAADAKGGMRLLAGDKVIAEGRLGDVPRSRDLQPAIKALMLDWECPDPKPRRLRVELQYDTPQATTRNDAADVELSAQR